MKERPILFSGPMVRALLAGTKTQTRRVVKPQPERRNIEQVGSMLGFKRRSSYGFWLWPNAREQIVAECPYGLPGDRLWVREAFMHEPADYCWEASVSIPCRPAETVYRADHDGDTRGAGWKPSIHMPRALSRITLEVTGVRVERLQDISKADAIAEGVSPEPRCLADDDTAAFNRIGPVANNSFPIARYAALWEQINGPESWAANPWVWVVEFKRLEAA